MTLLLPPEYQSFRGRVRFAASDGTLSASDRAQSASQAILHIEEHAGSQWVIADGGPHLFTAITKKLLPLDHSDPKWVMHMAMIYGLNAKDHDITPKITSFLASHCLWFGTKMTPRRWVAYVDGALHLSCYDGTVMRLTGAGVTEGHNNFLVDDAWFRGQGSTATTPVHFEVEDNGRHVLFADDDSGSMPTEPVIGRNGRLFKLLQGVNWSRETVGGLKPKHQVQALMIWMLAVAFPDLFPTKPILMAEGAPNSGKSTLMQMIQQALFGSIEPFVVSDDGERDFWVAMLRSPIMVLDNTDEVVDWLPNAVCSYTTRGYRTERRLHTNTGRVEIRPHSFIAVASKDPKSFRREDTADRTIVLRMESRFNLGGPGGDSASSLTARIASERDAIYGEWLYYLNRTVAAIHNEPARRTTSRLGDFEIFAYAACRALGWQSSYVVPALMDALARERTVFASEADTVLDILTDWMLMPSNPGRSVTVRDLYRELAYLAETSNKMFVKTPQALAQRLRAPHVRMMFDIQEVIAGDRKIYQIWSAAASASQN